MSFLIKGLEALLLATACQFCSGAAEQSSRSLAPGEQLADKFVPEDCVKEAYDSGWRVTFDKNKMPQRRASLTYTVAGGPDIVVNHYLTLIATPYGIRKARVEVEGSNGRSRGKTVRFKEGEFYYHSVDLKRLAGDRNDQSDRLKDVREIRITLRPNYVRSTRGVLDIHYIFAAAYSIDDPPLDAVIIQKDAKQ